MRNRTHFLKSSRHWGWYFKNLKQLKKELKANDQFRISTLFPILNERQDAGGITSGHYFHQDLLIAQRIFKNSPDKHVDIGSRTDGFVAHVAAYRPIEVLDIRKNNSQLDNINFVQLDFTNLGEEFINYTDSISSLHVFEHFGLGRYNDPIDANGHLKGLDMVYKMLKPDGKFYFSTPIGPQRIEFNAQRVFSIRYLLELFKPHYHIDQFSFVDDAGDLYKDVQLSETDISTSLGCTYGCGIFELSKK